MNVWLAYNSKEHKYSTIYREIIPFIRISPLADHHLSCMIRLDS